MARPLMIGVDLAKSVFQLHGALLTGEVAFSKKLSRQAFLRFMAEQPPAVVVLEVCGSAHYWARELARLGHEVSLIAAQYGTPFVKRQKYHAADAADAEAIVIAAPRPEMRFIEPKSEEQQQSRAILFRKLVNVLRPVFTNTVTLFRRIFTRSDRLKRFLLSRTAICLP